MRAHKYKVGQTLSFNPTHFEDGSKGSFQVTRQLPFEGVEFMYRIKSLASSLERVAPESQLMPLSGPDRLRVNAFKPLPRLGRG